MLSKYLHAALLLAVVFSSAMIRAQDNGNVAAKPLYRDPVYDGAADPVVVWNPKVKRWWMFYTNRRANAANLSGVTWVHGTPIGIAESADGGATWKYVGTADIDLPASFGGKDVTLWAPDVTKGDDGKWHMFLTVVPGIFEDWQHPRDIVQLTSKDMRKWEFDQTIKLSSSDRVIDPSIVKLKNGTWRLWYNNERDKKSIYYADSPDMKTWADKGKAVGDKPGEGPKVFWWKGKYWMINDQWHGLGVYRSDDALDWEPKNDNLLATPGKGLDDQVIGQHPDVVVSGNRAFLFYFTHPGRRPEAPKNQTEQRRSSMQVVELKLKDGWVTCDRDEPTHILLSPLL